MNGCSFSLYRFLFDRSERSCLNKCGYSSHNSLFFRSPILVLSIPAVPLLGGCCKVVSLSMAPLKVTGVKPVE
nr:hypothetical protein Q903MT_gene2130 [Picea sitchensis]